MLAAASGKLTAHQETLNGQQRGRCCNLPANRLNTNSASTKSEVANKSTRPLVAT